MAVAMFVPLMVFALIFWGASVFHGARVARAYLEWSELRDGAPGAGWHGPHTERLVEFLLVATDGGHAALRASSGRPTRHCPHAVWYGRWRAVFLIAMGVGLVTDVLT